MCIVNSELSPSYKDYLSSPALQRATEISIREGAQ